MKDRIVALTFAAMLIVLAGCGRAQTTEATVLSGQEMAAIRATPPPAIATPVPIVHAKTVAGSGRTDPFVILYGQYSAASSGPTPRPVAVSAFPNIPTLPGFPGSPGAGRPASIWDSVKLTGIFRAGGYGAIIEASGRSYIVRPGDLVAYTFRVVAIGPDSVTLATAKEQRRITLGG